MYLKMVYSANLSQYPIVFKYILSWVLSWLGEGIVWPAVCLLLARSCGWNCQLGQRDTMVCFGFVNTLAIYL